MKKLSLILLVSLFVVPLAYANQGYGDSLEGMYFGKVYFLFQNKTELGLTDDQIEKIKAIKFDMKRASINADSAKELAAVDIQQELHSDQPDLKKIDASVDAKHQAKSNLEKTMARALLDTKAVLTPEQVVKLKDLYYEEHSRKKGH